MDVTVLPMSDIPENQLEQLLNDSHDMENQSRTVTSTWESNGNIGNSRHFDPPHSTTPSSTSPFSGLDHQSQMAHQRRTGPNSIDASPLDADGATTTQFESPLRSMLASGQPTSSVSANTARASISTTNSVGTPHPLAALSNPGSYRRLPLRSGDMSSARMGCVNSCTQATHKEIDDPVSTFPTRSKVTIARGSQVGSEFLHARDEYASGSLSRRALQSRSASNTQRPMRDTSTLGGHLFHLGFGDGLYSDIAIQCFGQTYRLHKLLLARIPFFATAFSGGWIESSAQEMDLKPDDIDPHISRAAFELILKRVYGSAVTHEEEREAVGMFATSCWLDMQDIQEISADHILRQMRLPELYFLINLVTTSDYGRPGDRILSSAKALLCRDGWEMKIDYWDDIPAEVVREVVSGDPFYVPGEWERWRLALKLLNRRLRRYSIAADLISSCGQYLVSQPKHLRCNAVRDSDQAQEFIDTEHEDPWRCLYRHSEVVPLLQLLDTGIHYVHLHFEQMQHLRSARDILGVPVLPDRVVSNALWQSMELRQCVVNASDTDSELGISETISQSESENEEVVLDTKTRPRKAEEPNKRAELSCYSDYERPDSEMNERRYWIPDNDISSLVGTTNESYDTNSFTVLPEWKHRSQRFSTTLEAADVAWPPDLGASMSDGGVLPSRQYLTSVQPRFTRYPPFRFCAEFPNPRTLKEKKRVYSKIVFYAGSLWSLYIQRVNTTKSQQLGIYLHRAKEKEVVEDIQALTVDDRIGQLEREMLLGKSERRRHHWQTDVDLEDSPSDFTRGIGDKTNPALDTAMTSRVVRTHEASQISIQHPAASPQIDNTRSDNTYIAMSDDFHDVDPSSKNGVSAIPAYTDTRSKIKTYFRIYSPSKAGRILTVYESAPDEFNFGKSWGWKSSQMMLDDSTSDDAESGSLRDATPNSATARDGKLRYMVVIGNV